MSQTHFEVVKLDVPDSDISYIENFIDLDTSNSLYDLLIKTTPWQQDDIKVFGKLYPQPRLTAFYSLNTQPYSYSNISMQPHPFTNELLELMEKIKHLTNIDFNSCLINLYRNGKDSNGWHADDEKELGKNPKIASISLGQERFFYLRHKTDQHRKQKLRLAHGSMLLMQGATQHFWQHQIPKTTKPIGPRINLTFRILK